jgi:hypothetical protein
VIEVDVEEVAAHLVAEVLLAAAVEEVQVQREDKRFVKAINSTRPEHKTDCGALRSSSSLTDMLVSLLPVARKICLSPRT